MIPGFIFKPFFHFSKPVKEKRGSVLLPVLPPTTLVTLWLNFLLKLFRFGCFLAALWQQVTLAFISGLLTSYWCSRLNIQTVSHLHLKPETSCSSSQSCCCTVMLGSKQTRETLRWVEVFFLTLKLKWKENSLLDKSLNVLLYILCLLS